jgi:signal transduction histidine kinase
VRGQESWLGQCLANLLTNAAKFVAPGVRPRIRVWSEMRGPIARLWIEDNGIGIPPEFHANVFQVFARAPTERSYEGTGIGLAIVRKTVEKMGGSCGVESDGRSGSRFWIELALAE